MGKNKTNKNKKNAEMNDWIVSLAKQSAASATSETTNVPTLSKEERKQKRATKKARKQQQLEERKHPRHEEVVPRKQSAKVDNSKRHLKQLAKLLLSIREGHESCRVPFLPKDQPSKKRKRPINEENVQPRPSDYSGIGLARESLFLSFLDPSHIPKLEEEFHEHIPGFFGKQRTKAMKRQLDGDMLWRKMAEQREKGGVPKKFKHLSPDDRVQAMIDAGMI